MEKIYFCIDMKSFYASVECRERGLDPMKANLVVADISRGKGGVCLAVSPHLKSLGVLNRCRLYEVPSDIDFIIAKPRMKKYIEYASKIYAIYLKYIDKKDIHVYSIDEAFLFATPYLKLYSYSPHQFAKLLMNEIQSYLGLPSTAGIGTNLFLAKVALDILAKNNNDGIGYLDEELFKKNLWHHKPITDFWMIADGKERRLMKLGLEDMCAIAHCKESVLYNEFGIDAELLIDHAKGLEPCTILDIKNYQKKSQSLSFGQMLPKNYNYIDARTILKEMLLNGCYELFKKGKVSHSVNITLGYGDNQSPHFSKGHITIASTTNLYYIFEDYALSLFDKIVDRLRPIRKIAISFGSIKSLDYEFYDLLVDMKRVEKEKKIALCVVQMHNKFGKNAILKGINFMKNATQITRNKLIGGHNSE